MSADRARAMTGAEDGYVYTGDESSYLVTMLRREPKRGVALVKIERDLTGMGSIPNGSEVTVPLRRVELRR